MEKRHTPRSSPSAKPQIFNASEARVKVTANFCKLPSRKVSCEQFNHTTLTYHIATTFWIARRSCRSLGSLLPTEVMEDATLDVNLSIDVETGSAIEQERTL